MFNIRAIDNAVIIGVNKGDTYEEMAFLSEDTEAETKASAYIDTAQAEAAAALAERAKTSVAEEIQKVKNKQAANTPAPK